MMPPRKWSLDLGTCVITWPTSPPVHDSALAICQWRLTRARPSRRAAASRSSSVGGRRGIGLAVVRELQRHRVVERLEVADHGLELVPGLRRHADGVALDDRL